MIPLYALTQFLQIEILKCAFKNLAHQSYI